MGIPNEISKCVELVLMYLCMLLKKYSNLFSDIWTCLAKNIMVVNVYVSQ